MKEICPVCKKNKGVEQNGVKLTMGEKVAIHLERQSMASKLLVDPLPIPPAVLYVSLLFKTMFRCPTCGWIWKV